MYPIVFGLYQETIGGISSQARLLKEIVNNAFVGMSISEQDLIKVRYNSNEKFLSVMKCIIFVTTSIKRIKLFE